MIHEIAFDDLVYGNDYRWSAYASEIGFPVGAWPTALRVVKPGLANDQTFALQNQTDNEAVYLQECGIVRIVVVND